MDRFTIGALGRTSYASYTPADIAEIIVYEDNLTDENRGNIEDYLASKYSGLTWQASLTTEPEIVFMNGTKLTKGSDQNSLNDHEWYWVGDVLYVRDDSGDPDGSVTIEATVRDNGISLAGKDYITIDNLKFKGFNDK